uniref:Target of rapamycin complex 2 subunit MAPKAP1 n=1 Tax=Canis lupus familiaris TaxID=9615 RepID=A0A8C0T6X5_CANLF
MQNQGNVSANPNADPYPTRIHGSARPAASPARKLRPRPHTDRRRAAHAYHHVPLGPAPREGSSPSRRLWGLRTAHYVPSSGFFPVGDFRCAGCGSGSWRDLGQQGCCSGGGVGGGGGERRGHEGEPEKRQLNRRGGAPVPEDSESAEAGAGTGRRGEAGPFPQERIPGPIRPVVWQQLQGHVGTTATKKIDVYLPLHSSQDRLLPMTVVTMASARVQDLIGLICWQYTSEGREPKLNDNVSAYCLHIAEDDGEVDTDFPPLDSNEPIHKFGFSTLALVEKYSSPGLTSKESLFVRINAAHGFSLIQVDNTKVTMKEILLKAVKRRKGSQKISGPQYRLEKQSEPNVAVDLESTLESQSAWEFCLVRENSSRADGVFEEDSQIDIATVQDMLSSHHYKSFKVSMIHRLRFTTDVQLGISGDKIEIDPVTNQKASTKFWIKQKPISIDSDLLCACDLAEEKSPSHAIFKLTYLSNHDYKHLYFESDAATVNEIVLKVNYILESRASTARADYFAQKQRKLNRRTSFSFQKEKKSGQQ